jgi:hypothetical protein
MLALWHWHIEISNKFNLNNIDLVNSLKHEFWTSEFTSFKWNECSNKCAKNSDTNYYLEW